MVEKETNNMNPSEDLSTDIEKNKDEKKSESIDLDVTFVEKPSGDGPDYADRVESQRSELFKEYKKSKNLSNIAMIVILAFAVGAVILITRDPMVCKIIGWVLVGIAVVGMILFYVLTHNKFPNRTKEYIKDITYILNQRNFDNQQFDKVQYNAKEKLEASDITCDNVYKDFSQVSSRNIVKGKFDHHSFVCGDLALYADGPKRSKMTLFVGKYITLQNDLHFEGRYVLVSKQANPVDLPNNVSDLSVLFEDETHVIYGPEHGKYNEDLGREFVSRINRINIGEGLINLNVVVWAGHSAAYVSYNDDVMSIPFDKPFSRAANENFRANLYEILSDLRKLLK